MDCSSVSTLIENDWLSGMKFSRQELVVSFQVVRLVTSHAEGIQSISIFDIE